MKKKIMLGLIVLVALSFLTSVDAKEINATDNSILAGEDTPEPIALESDGVDNSLQVTSDENLTSAKQSVKDSSSSAYLIIDNDADKENVHIGDYVTWLVDVYNAGPDTAKNVKVFDRIPDGLKFIKYKASQGTFNPKTGIWDIGDIPNLGSAWLRIVTQAMTLGEKVNKVNVTTDSINLNNETYEEEEIDVEADEDHGDDDYPTMHHPNTIKSAGNPIVLILLSLLGCFVGCFRGNRKYN